MAAGVAPGFDGAHQAFGQWLVGRGLVHQHAAIAGREVEAHFVERHVPGAINRLTFELRQCCHRDRSLQSQWNERGTDGVAMDVLELVRERSDPSFDYAAELALLTNLYRQELSPEAAP